MSKLRRKFIAVLAMLFCVLLILSTALMIPKSKTASAVTSGSTNYTVSDLLGSNAVKPFNGDNLSDLYYRLTGEQGATYSSVASKVDGMETSSIIGYGHLPGGGVMPKFLDAANIRTNVRKTKNQNNVTITGELLVNLNGKIFSPVYLTRDNDNNVILTLWLSETYKTAQWNEWASANCSYAYPSNMYSTSKAHAYLMGTDYIPRGTSTSIPAGQLASGASIQSTEWMDFIKPSSLLYNYIVSPVNVKYQEVQSYTSSLISSASNYTLANEAWGEPFSKNFYSSGNINADYGGYGSTPNSKGDIYTVWKNDKIWLPSMSEVGNILINDTGIWNLSNEQRCNGDYNTGSATSGVSLSWVRTGTYNSANNWFPAISSNGTVGIMPNVNSAIRPALHLNLTKAEENSARSLTVPTDVSNAYNGKEHNFSDLTAQSAWYNEDVYTDSSKIKVECPANMVDVGEYTVKVTLLDTVHYYWSDGNTSSNTRTFKYKITKAPLNIQTLKVDENGNLQGDGSVNDIITNTYLSTTLYERDVGKSSAPRFGVQYKRTNGGSWSTNVPEIAGEYYVRAYIINDDNLCNYYLASDGQATFKKPKEYVETPHFTQEGLKANQIVGSTTTVQYSGDYQEFKLVNTPDNKLVGVNIGERTGGLSYDQKTGTFRAKAVGIYTVEALLEDGGANTQWDNDSVETSRIITLIITRAELRVNIPDGDMTSWTKGDIDYITVEVTGVRNSENVKLDVYYMVTGSSVKTYVADSAMTLNDKGDTIIVTVNLATFDTNKEYQLFVALREDIAVNDNYTIVNNSEPYKFFIMTATINDDEVVEAWTISNLISGTKEATNGLEVDFNGSSYTLALDESKLVKGLEATYTNPSFTNVKEDGGFYTTKVLLTCESGYQLASGKSSITFEISWKINPIEYDVVDLIWADNPEWDNDKTLTMSIVNLPNWLTGDYYRASGHRYSGVGSYTATYTLMSDGNYVFTYSGEDKDNNKIEYEGQQAKLIHEWEITKKIINVTNAPKQWTTEAVEYSSGDSYYFYNIYVPAGIDLSLIKVTYWEDDGFSIQVTDIRKLEVDYSESKTYYIKIEIANDWKETCALYNTLTKGDFAYTSFVVGGDMTIIEVTYETADELMYNGKPQDVTAKYRNFNFKYTYYKLGESSPLEGAPTEVGEYRVVIAIEGEDAERYWIQNSVFYFTITPLVLTTNGYEPATGNQLKKSVVISDADVNTSDYFEYQIFNKNNQRVYEPLEYNTTYTVKLVIKDEHKEHAIWADDAVTTYTFTTSFNPDAETEYLDDPTITVKDKDGTTVDTDSVVWTGNDYTVTINDWDKIAAFVTVTVNGQEDNNGSYNFSDVGVYTITITIKEEVLLAEAAAWLWDNGSGSKTLTFEIIKRYVAIPTANGELQYTGEEQYLFPDGYEQDYINLSGGAIISATEIGGEWKVKLSLKDKVNSCWADGTTDDLTFTWKIVKASITGKWVIKDGYAQFVPDDEVYADKFTITYYDADGNEVAVEDMVEGKTYNAKITIKEEYAGKCGFADEVETEYEFIYGSLSEDDLDRKKQEAKDALEEAAKKKKEEIDSNPDLTDDEKKGLKDKVDEELQKGKDAIDGATDIDGIDSSFNEAKKNIENISAETVKSSFPWWIIALIGGALLLLTLLIIIIVKRRQADDEDDYYDDYYDDEYDYDEEYEELDGGYDDDF